MFHARPFVARALVAVVALAAVCGAVAGCGGARPPVGAAAPPQPAPAARPAPGAARPAGEAPLAPGGEKARPGYDRPAPSLTGLDTSALRGRRIVIDPGHGGRFPGSIGPTGVTEAEVNLGVALHLWGLLADAGAEVRLTRTTDRDLTTPSDSSLRADLAARVDEARAFDPDAFVSIHHNADLSGRHDLNETQAYYRLADPLASVALARAVNARLVDGLDVGADRLLPGNYFVVRNAPCPAMLGESSYLTNPAVESRLALAARQRIEAVAYFLGLLDYFRAGVPRVASLGALPGPVVTAGDSADARERPWITARVDRAPGTARLVVDGTLADTARIERVAPVAGDSAWTLRYRPADPLTDGAHDVEWTVQSAAGTWSGGRADSFEVRLAPARVALEIAPAAGRARAGQVVGLTLSVRDRHGRPLARAAVATFTATVGARMVDSLTAQALARAVPGERRAYARLAGGSVAEFTYALARPAVPRALANGRARLVLAPEGAGGARTRTGFVRAAGAGGAWPVAGALVRGPAPGDTARANADGFWALAADSLTAEAPGYVTAPAPGKGDDLALAAIANAALVGRRIVLDAAGGGADTTARPDSLARPDTALAGPAGADSARADSLRATLRARVIEADANLRVARALGDFLTAAGARVLLTRETPDSLSTLDRLRASEAFGGDRLLTISHRGAPGTLFAGHYFASAAGKALAERLAARWSARGLGSALPVAATPSYLVQQTGAVAAAVDLPAATEAYVDRTRAAAQLRDEAYALYLGLLEDLGGDPAAFTRLDVKVTEAGVPEEGVPVELDHRWLLLTGADGMAHFDGLPPRAILTVVAGAPGAAVTTRVTLPHPATVTLAIPSGR